MHGLKYLNKKNSHSMTGRGWSENPSAYALLSPARRASILVTYMSRIRSRRAKKPPNSIFRTNLPLTSGIVLIRLPNSEDDFLKTSWRFSMPVFADRIKIFFVLLLGFNLMVTNIWHLSQR